jgi:hypothetical protein
MVTKYSTRIKVLIEPVWFKNIPSIEIGVNGNYQTAAISEDTWFEFELVLPRSTCQLEVRYTNKQLEDTDVITGKDTAVIIKEIIINDIKSPKFVWQGVYYPIYPTHVRGESKLTPHTYLGWNGTWKLDIEVPVYTWIHKVENLGWIYD